MTNAPNLTKQTDKKKKHKKRIYRFDRKNGFQIRIVQQKIHNIKRPFFEMTFKENNTVSILILIIQNDCTWLGGGGEKGTKVAYF